MSLSYAAFESGAIAVSKLAPALWSWRPQKSILVPNSGYLISQKRYISRRPIATAVTAKSELKTDSTAASALESALAACEDSALAEIEPELCTAPPPHVAAAASTIPAAAAELDEYVYHVVYNSTYHVPVLLFSAVSVPAAGSAGGSSSVCSLEQILANIPREYSHEHAKHALDASFITQIEHPVLSLPFYGVHPCKTMAFMSAILEHCKTQQTAAAAAAAAATAAAASGDTKSDTTTASASSAVEYLLCWLSIVGPIIGCNTPASLARSTPAAATPAVAKPL